MLDLDSLSRNRLKAEFTRITKLPAKQAFVSIAAPSLAGCTIRSKADWILAIESIELVLTPVFDDPTPDAVVESEDSTIAQDLDVESSDNCGEMREPEKHLAQYLATTTLESAERVL